MVTRRQFIAAGSTLASGVLGGALLTGRGGPTGVGAGVAVERGHGSHGGSAAPADAPPATPFSVRMPVPPQLRPARSQSGVDYYQIPIRPANVEIFPGIRTPILSYGGGFVGPTIRTRARRRVRVEFTNQLAEQANVHLHGGNISPENDGHPLDVIPPGGRQVYEYPNRQLAATLWYHDHSHHTEAEHVYRGLHGFYLIDDPAERRFRLPDGEYDVPIMLRDAAFDEQGALLFDPFNFDRPTVLVNGKPQPYFPVAARKYRFRLLNSSTHGILRLDLDGAEMIQIGSDGGLLPVPVSRTELVLGPAERAEIVVDFSGHQPGSQLVLSETRGPVLRFDVVRPARDRSRVPDQLREVPALPPATRHRDVTLSTDFENIVSLINGRPFDPDRIDFRIPHGSTEIWEVHNADTDFGGIFHTMHLHLVHYQVLDRNGAPPPPEESGLKDTVLIPPGERVRLKARFHSHLGRYVFHCHMLEHSAFGMMAQFEVVR